MRTGPLYRLTLLPEVVTRSSCGHLVCWYLDDRGLAEIRNSADISVWRSRVLHISSSGLMVYPIEEM